MSVLVIDPSRNDVTFLGEVHEVDELVAQGVDSRMCGKWIEGCKIADGRIFGVPVHASSVLVISPPMPFCAHDTANAAMECAVAGMMPDCGGEKRRWTRSESAKNPSAAGYHLGNPPPSSRRRWVAKATVCIEDKHS